MLMQHAFTDTVDTTYLNNAIQAHASMGYNFRIRKVTASVNIQDTRFVDLSITVEQVGVAPFYYPLDLVVSCDGMDTTKRLVGVEHLVDQYATKDFIASRIPAMQKCLDTIKIYLHSTNLYTGTIVKFAQSGSFSTASDGTVRLKVPLPAGSNGGGDGYTLNPTHQRRPTSNPVRKARPKRPRLPVPQPSSPKRSPTSGGQGPGDSPTNAVAITFALYETNSDQKIAQLKSGSQINLSNTGSDLSIVIDVTGFAEGTKISNVEFTWTENGKSLSHRESASPYSVPGNSGTNFYPFKYLQITGPKSITAKVYYSSSTTISNRTINFDVIS
jgi:hypothetical protein